MKNLFYLVLILFILLNSCSIEKRTYNKGYYVQWNKNNKKSENKSTSLISIIDTNKFLDTNISVTKIEVEDKFPVYIASTENIEVDFIKSAPLFKNELNTECDIIVLKNGEEIKVKVIEIGVKEIKYKLCDYIDGPTISILKSKALIVIYPNGRKDVINSGNIEEDDLATYDNTKSLSMLSMVFGIISLFGIVGLSFGLGFLGILSIASLIIGRIAINRINENPDDYPSKYKKWANAGIICSWITIGLLALYLTLLLI